MKTYFFLFIILLLSCSTARHLNNKWVGKTDQEVVNKLGMPDSVAGNENNGKIYFYNSVVPSNLHKYIHPVTNGSLENTYPEKRSFYVEKYIFFIDSLNKVCRVLSIDSNYTQGNFFYIKH